MVMQEMSVVELGERVRAGVLVMEVDKDDEIYQSHNDAVEQDIGHYELNDDKEDRDRECLPDTGRLHCQGDSVPRDQYLWNRDGR